MQGYQIHFVALTLQAFRSSCRRLKSRHHRCSSVQMLTVSACSKLKARLMPPCSRPNKTWIRYNIMHTAPLHVGSLCRLTMAKQVMPSVKLAVSAYDTENMAEKIWQKAAASGKGACTACPLHCAVCCTSAHWSSILCLVTAQCHAMCQPGICACVHNCSACHRSKASHTCSHTCSSMRSMKQVLRPYVSSASALMLCATSCT